MIVKNLMIRTLVLLLIPFLIIISNPSLAQQGKTGYLGKGRDQYSVFIFGDALAGGLWAGSARITKGHPRLKLNGRYREGSGLAKPQFYNWPERLPRILQNRQVDIAIVFIGTNDTQDIRSNGEYLVFNSEPWRQTYTKAVATMMKQLTDAKAAVYWLEVPPVSRPTLDKRLKIIADIHQKEAQKAGIRFVKIRKYLTTSDDKYTESGAGINGNIIRLRSRNGVRFIKPGNDKLASIVLEQIERDIAIADGDKPVSSFPVPDASKIASVEVAPYIGPIFGSSSSDNLPLIIQPQDMPLAGADQSANVLVSIPTFGSKDNGADKGLKLAGNATLARLKQQVSPGSTAYSLFVDGTWPTTEPGRLDNFGRSTR